MSVSASSSFVVVFVFLALASCAQAAPQCGPWMSWDECSKECGGGEQTRVKECLPTYVGSDIETRECNTDECPVIAAFKADVVADDCRDRSSLCGSLTIYCSDSSHGSWMKSYCTKTCAFCGADGEREVSSTPETEEAESTQITPDITTTPAPEPTTEPEPEPTPEPEPEPEPTREGKKGKKVGECGVPEYQGSRIVGGDDAAPGKWPWQILMLYNGFAGCGGSIINANWVLSAAHCVYSLTKYTSDFTIRTGEFNRNVYEDTEREYEVEKIYIHPDYNPRVLNNDISLLKLKTPIMFDKFRQPVCLPEKPAKEGDECYITGWGKLKWTELMTPILQEGKLPIVDSKTCDTLNRKQIHIPVTDAMLCAGSGGKSALSGCHGDSGGPFVCRYGNHWELQGAVSHGSPYCNSTQSYTVFASVSHFLPWVQKTMAGEQ